MGGLGPGARCADQRLRRHAADDEAVATHEVPLNEGHTGAQPCGDRGGDEAARPRAHDDQIGSGPVGEPGSAIPPGMQGVEQVLIECIERGNAEAFACGVVRHGVMIPQIDRVFDT